MNFATTREKLLKEYYFSLPSKYLVDLRNLLGQGEIKGLQFIYGAKPDKFLESIWLELSLNEEEKIFSFKVTSCEEDLRRCYDLLLTSLNLPSLGLYTEELKVIRGKYQKVSDKAYSEVQPLLEDSNELYDYLKPYGEDLKYNYGRGTEHVSYKFSNGGNLCYDIYHSHYIDYILFLEVYFGLTVSYTGHSKGLNIKIKMDPGFCYETGLWNPSTGRPYSTIGDRDGI